jgi:hypothetical protein
MRFPAYVFLPILGAVVLTAAVLGSWLWPAPTIPAPSREPSGVAVPVASAPPAPTPAPLPPPSRPVSRPVAAKAAPAVPPPSLNPVPPPSEPVAVAPAPPMAPPGSQITDLSPQAREGIQKKWSSLRNRAADMALRGVENLERQRDEARARGDQAEYERLEALIRQHRERVDLMRGARPEAPAAGPGVPAPAQSGPPMQ